MLEVNSWTEVAWRLHVLDAIFLVSSIVALRHAVGEYRTGRRAYLVLWLSCLAYGVVLELTTGMQISQSYVQGEFLLNLDTTSMLGYGTDMPLYILLLYPTFIYLGFHLVESMGIASIHLRAVAAGVFMLLIDAPYVLFGDLEQVRWWTWLDWEVYGQPMFEFWYGWPMVDAYWEMTWPGLLMWLVWRWEEREATRSLTGAPTARRRHLISVPLAHGVAINVLGPLTSAPLSVFLVLGWPQYLMILPLAVAQVAVLLLARKQPLGLPRTGWTLVAIHVAGYAVVAVSLLQYGELLAGPITLVALSFSAMVLLAAWSRRARRADEAASSRPAVDLLPLGA